MLAAVADACPHRRLLLSSGVLEQMIALCSPVSTWAFLVRSQCFYVQLLCSNPPRPIADRSTLVSYRMCLQGPKAVSSSVVLAAYRALAAFALSSPDVSATIAVAPEVIRGLCPCPTRDGRPLLLSSPSATATGAEFAMSLELHLSGQFFCRSRDADTAKVDGAGRLHHGCPVSVPLLLNLLYR